MIITVFEDQSCNSLFPLNINRASFELRSGAFTNLDRILNCLSSEDSIQLIVRENIAPLVNERYPELLVNPSILSPGLWLNGSAIWTEEILDKINKKYNYSCNGKIMAMNVIEEGILFKDFFSFIDKSITITNEISIYSINNIWDAIFLLPDVINIDVKHFINYNQGKLHPSVIIENEDNIFISNDAEIRAGSILDATCGPIIIDKNVIVDIGSLIQGPVYIGPCSKINPGSKLRGNISIGAMCKIGGEIEDVIFHGYSNKQHDGFIGHSYIGEWVNLGANTNTSDLKNNYSTIKLNVNGELIDTEKQFLGSIIGDYSRTGISTMLNTGTIIGLGANVFGSGFQNKYIPSFQWGKEDITDFDKFISTIKKIKKRRNMHLSGIENEFLQLLYKN